MMEIDIIDYTDEQLAILSAGQLQQVITAQKKKKALGAAMKKALSEKRAELIDQGIFHSDLWGDLKLGIMEDYENQINELREGLLLYLHYSVKLDESLAILCPYKLDYSLSLTERYKQVKAYYDEEYTDNWARYSAFQNDKYAVTYLGEMYYTLYEVFRYEYEGNDGAIEVPEP